MNVIFLILDAKYCFNSILCHISSLCNYLVYYEIYLFGYCELGYWSQFQMAFKTLQITIVFGRQRYFNLQYYSFLYLHPLIKPDFWLRMSFSGPFFSWIQQCNKLYYKVSSRSLLCELYSDDENSWLSLSFLICKIAWYQLSHRVVRMIWDDIKYPGQYLIQDRKSVNSSFFPPSRWVTNRKPFTSSLSQVHYSFLDTTTKQLC